MARLCAAFALAAFSTAAAAEWTLIGGIEDIFSAYADRDTIQRQGSSVNMWGIYDFNRADVSIDGQPHRSTKVLREYDCGERRVRLLSFIDYSGRMGSGREIASDNSVRRWEPVVPGAVDESFWRVACGI